LGHKPKIIQVDYKRKVVNLSEKRGSTHSSQPSTRWVMGRTSVKNAQVLHRGGILPLITCLLPHHELAPPLSVGVHVTH
jgi:hypothetical protein